MLDFDIYEFYESSKNKKIILSFKGLISQQLLIDVGEIIKGRSETQKWTKKIFSVFVELSQNMMHYSEERELDPKSGEMRGVGIILFHETANQFLVTSGNIAKNESAKKIQRSIEELNSLDSAELKKLYNTRLRQPRPEGSKGAGLGLIEIARKSSGRIFCQIQQLENDNVFLTISTYFDKEVVYEV